MSSAAVKRTEAAEAESGRPPEALNVATTEQLAPASSSVSSSSVSAGDHFRPITADGDGVLPGTLLHGEPPPHSTVYEAPQRCKIRKDFDGETSGWGRVSPEYREYTDLEVLLEPTGIATFTLDDGVYRSRGTGYEFRGSMAYRVAEGGVAFYVDTIELAPAESWHLPRGPGGKRVKGQPGRLIADERTPAELFEDAWNGKRESRMCSSASWTKLRDHMWPVAARVALS